MSCNVEFDLLPEGEEDLGQHLRLHLARLRREPREFYKLRGVGLKNARHPTHWPRDRLGWIEYLKDVPK